MVFRIASLAFVTSLALACTSNPSSSGPRLGATGGTGGSGGQAATGGQGGAEAGAPTVVDSRLPPSLLDGRLKRSAVVLMPGWEFVDVTEAAPLNPTVVGWGEDAIWSKADRAANAAKYKSMGVDLLAANVWMLTATKEKMTSDVALQDATCVAIDGTKLVPPWLDGELDGVPDYWGCTNHPRFREQIRQRATDGIEAGANLLHLDDHMGTAAAAHEGGCFCEHCMAGFTAWLADHRSDEELAALGVSDVASFNYKEFLNTQGIATLADYQARKSSLPLREEFLTFQYEANAAFVGELKDLAAQTHGDVVPLGINAWNLEPKQLSNTHVADYFSTEVTHHGVEDTNPPFIYKLSDGLGRPMLATAAGDDWVKAQQADGTPRVRSWIALAYAFGHHFMYAYRQWAFDPSAGTSWYEPEISVYEPITSFVTDNAALFDGYQPVADIGLLYSNAQPAPTKSVAQALHEANIQFRIVVAGDERLQHQLRAEDADGLAFVCIAGSPKLDADQQAVVDAWVAAGKAGPCSTADDVTAPRVRFGGSENAWALVRDRASAPLVVHLLNREYADTGNLAPYSDVVVEIPAAYLDGRRTVTVTAHAPGQAATPLASEVTDDALRVTLPELAMWTVLSIE